MKRLQGMELFVEVAKTHSFSRAASLGIPKSTLSRQVAELERSVGLRLLSRTTRKVELTDAGRLYFERCQLIVAEAQIAHEELQKLVDTPVGPLRVNMPADFGTDFLAESFMEFSCAIRTSPSILTSPTRTTRSACSRPATCPSRSANCPTRRRSRALGMLPAHLYASREYLENTGSPSIPATSPATSASSSARKAPAASRAGR